MPSIPTVSLPSGDELPLVGFGTGSNVAKPESDSISSALDVGYTLFDTAEGYGTEDELGSALASAERDDLLLASKVLPKHMSYDAMIEACEASLDRLGTDYLDLYLLHWPNPAVSLRETLAALATLHDRGLVRNIGVSNFSVYQLSCALHLTDIAIAVNQIEFHPWFQRRELVNYCQENDIVVQAAAPLARTRVFDDDVVRNLAEQYDRPAAQIVLKWAIERGICVLPKSLSSDHIRTNAALFDWSMDTADLRSLDEQDRNEPIYTHDVGLNWDDDEYGIAE